MRTIAIVASLLASATALRVPAEQPKLLNDKLLKLRGGGEMGPLIVSATAAIGGATGVSMYMGTEKITQYIWLGLNKFPHDQYIAVAMIGWAVGMLSAVRAGQEATRAFAQLNTIPLFLWLLTNFKTGAALTTSIIPSLLFAAYVYAGFVEEP